MVECTWLASAITAANENRLEDQFSNIVSEIFGVEARELEVDYNYISPDTTAMPDTTTTAGDMCNDGNNGGCSHVCSNNMCHCPDCWELEDGKSCKPASGTVLLDCNSDSMTIKMNKCVAPDANMVALTDRLCDADEQSDGDYYTIQTNLDACSTGLAQADNGDLIFSNEIFASAYHNSIIFTAAETRIKFHCR